MKQYQNLLFFFFCLSILSACQKEGSVEVSNNTTGGGSAGRAKSYTETYIHNSDTTSYTVNFTYDNSGRIVATTAADDPSSKYVFSFPSANKYTFDIYGAGEHQGHGDVFLNAKSLNDSTFAYGIPGDTTTQKVVYNADGLMTTNYNYDYSARAGSVLTETISYTYDAGNNLVQESSTDGYVYTYEYYTDAKYAPPYIIGPVNAYTQRATYLRKKTTAAEGGVVESAQHTYTFDNKQRIASERVVASDGSIIVKSYTYE